MDTRFDRIDHRFDKMDNKMEKVEFNVVEIHKDRKELKYNLDHYILFKVVWISWIVSLVINTWWIILFR